MKNHSIVAKIIHSAVETHQGAKKETSVEEELANEVLIQTVRFALKKTGRFGETFLLAGVALTHLPILGSFFWILIEMKRVLG